MNTKLSNQFKEIINSFDELLKHDSEEAEIQHDANILMFRFLTETQKYQDVQGINRKSLARKIKTSASYLTQLFRGDKPLNFTTLAKFQRALNISFEVKACPNQKEIEIEDEAIWLKNIHKYKVDGGFWCYKNASIIKQDLYIEDADDVLNPDINFNYDYKAIPA